MHLLSGVNGPILYTWLFQKTISSSATLIGINQGCYSAQRIEEELQMISMNVFTCNPRLQTCKGMFSKEATSQI